MTNPYYNPSGVPVTRAQLSSAAMRSEMASVAAGFDKLAPTLTANALLHVNAAGTQQTAHASIMVSAAGALAGITDLTTTGNTVLGNASTDTLNVGNGGIFKDTSNNVAIGHTNPQQLLHLSGSNTTLRVDGTAGTPARLELSSGGAVSWSIRANAYVGSELSIGPDAVPRALTVASTGNLGLFTNSPLARLHSTANATYKNAIWDTDAHTVAAYCQYRVNGSAGWEVGMSQASEGYDYRWCYGPFGPSNSRMRLDSSGNLIQRLQGVVPTLNNQEAVMTFPDNSTLRLTFKGTDGIERYIDLALTT